MSDKIWKITNTEKTQDPIKTTIRVENTKTIAVAIAPGEFVLAMPYSTSQLEAQSLKRKFLAVEANYDNSYLNLELGKVYQETETDKLKKKV